MGKEAVALTSPIRSSLRRWWPFALLILAGASRWIVAGVHPEANPTLASEALGCTWAALVSLALLSRRRSLAPSNSLPTRPIQLRSILSGAMVFGGPAVALLLRAHEVDSGGLTIALALTPVIIAITCSALGTESSDGIAGRLWPGLAAAAGLLLLLAQPSLGDARSDLALVLAPTLTGIGAALLCADETPFPWQATYALFGAAALFSITLLETYFIAGIRPSVSLLAVACDGAIALVGILALMHLGATRWSSQFTWVPLLIVLQGLVLMRPQLTGYWVVGLLLLALASVYLLLPADEQPGTLLPATPGPVSEHPR